MKYKKKGGNLFLLNKRNNNDLHGDHFLMRKLAILQNTNTLFPNLEGEDIKK